MAKLTESALRNIIKEELKKIVAESTSGFFNPGGIDASETSFYGKHVDRTASGKPRSPAVSQDLRDMLTSVQKDIETMKTNPPSGEEYNTLRKKILDTLERMQLVGRF